MEAAQWKADTIVEPNAKVSGSTSGRVVAAAPSAPVELVNGSELICSTVGLEATTIDERSRWRQGLPLPGTCVRSAAATASKSQDPVLPRGSLSWWW